ncbi:MAG: TIGR03905 family TSCPD domain-containing protein, partial [Moorella sp. (in: Bacteria)]|nr:TIGR03905 family TSCPD domain-containing protein [Moorella sp. (in: firmicutes)]
MYVYRTKGVCPSEIHFHLDGNTLRSVRFVGGGCKGNLDLIGRLLEGQDVNQIMPLLQGIKCRNDTSCPGQLFQAILLAKKGELEEAEAPRVYEAPEVHRKVAVIAELDGNLPALEAVTCLSVDAVYCLGNLTGPHGANDAVVEAARNG